jgi:hypothetical protein
MRLPIRWALVSKNRITTSKSRCGNIANKRRVSASTPRRVPQAYRRRGDQSHEQAAAIGGMRLPANVASLLQAIQRNRHAATAEACSYREVARRCGPGQLRHMHHLDVGEAPTFSAACALKKVAAAMNLRISRTMRVRCSDRRWYPGHSMGSAASHRSRAARPE